MTAKCPPSHLRYDLPGVPRGRAHCRYPRARVRLALQRVRGGEQGQRLGGHDTAALLRQRVRLAVVCGTCCILRKQRVDDTTAPQDITCSKRSKGCNRAQAFDELWVGLTPLITGFSLYSPPRLAQPAL